jgi:hypothetical protein
MVATVYGVALARQVCNDKNLIKKSIICYYFICILRQIAVDDRHVHPRLRQRIKTVEENIDAELQSHGRSRFPLYFRVG